jgi:hypothetical protein
MQRLIVVLKEQIARFALGCVVAFWRFDECIRPVQPCECGD